MLRKLAVLFSLSAFVVFGAVAFADATNAGTCAATALAAGAVDEDGNPVYTFSNVSGTRTCTFDTTEVSESDEVEVVEVMVRRAGDSGNGWIVTYDVLEVTTTVYRNVFTRVGSTTSSNRSILSQNTVYGNPIPVSCYNPGGKEFDISFRQCQLP